MKLPRPRFTIRQFIVAIAIVGSLLAYGERWRRYKRLAAYHRDKADETGFFGQFSTILTPTGKTITIESNGHMSKSREYDFAAPRPWLSVSPEVIPVDPVTPDDFVHVVSPATPADASSKDGPGPPPFDRFK